MPLERQQHHIGSTLRGRPQQIVRDVFHHLLNAALLKGRPATPCPKRNSRADAPAGWQVSTFGLPPDCAPPTR